MIGYSNKGRRIGYYNHGHFLKDERGQIYISFDIALWVDEFIKHTSEFVCFLNQGNLCATKQIPSSFSALNDKVKVVNLGKQKSHWKKLLGIGLSRKLIKEETNRLDAIIIQGPTPQQNQIARNVAKSCSIVCLLVGMWQPWPRVMFRSLPWYREALINILKFQNRVSTRRLINRNAKIFCGNNPDMPLFYKSRKEFHLISKGLVKESEVREVSFSKSLNSPIQLTFYSRLDPEKYVELIVLAIGKLRFKGIDIELNIYGDSNSEKYIEFLGSFIINEGLSDFVRMKGGVRHNERSKVFERSDLYVFNTCTTEGFPRTIWEAFAFGIPTICVSCPGIDKYLRDGEEVILFKQNDLADLTEKIERLVNDYNLREKIASGASILLKENTLESSVNRFYGLIHDSLAT